MAEVAVEVYGLPRKVDPHLALLEEVHRCAGHVAWLAQEVRSLTEAQVVWGVSRRTTEAPQPLGDQGGDAESKLTLSTVKTEARAEVSVWLKLYMEERKQLVEVSCAAIACGVVELQVRVSERQAQLIRNVIAGVLGDLGVDLDEDGVRSALRRHLTLASGASEFPRLTAERT
jgi:hypothetical protein